MPRQNQEHSAYRAVIQELREFITTRAQLSSLEPPYTLDQTPKPPQKLPPVYETPPEYTEKDPKSERTLREKISWEKRLMVAKFKAKVLKGVSKIRSQSITNNWELAQKERWERDAGCF